MARVLVEDELIEHWTLVGDELGLLTGPGTPVATASRHPTDQPLGLCAVSCLSFSARAGLK